MDSRYQFAYLTDQEQHISINDLDYAALEEAAGVKLSWDVPLIQQEMGIQGGPVLIVNAAINGFLTAHLTETEAPTLPHAKKYYQEAHKHASALIKLLDKDDPTNRRLRASVMPVACDSVAFEQLLKEIADRSHWNHGWHSMKPGKTGRPELLARQGLLSSLYSVWKTAGGEGKGVYRDHYKNGHAGPFYALAKELIDQLQHLDKLQNFAGLPSISDGLGKACIKTAEEYTPPDTSNIEL